MSGTTPGSWAERDAAVVWHGFTQMAASVDNAPLVMERAEGRELIDADGCGYLDAISLLGSTPCGTGSPSSMRPSPPRPPGWRTRRCSATATRSSSSWRRRWPGWSRVEEPHFPFAADGAVAVERALKIAFQYRVNVGRGSGRPQPDGDGCRHADDRRPTRCSPWMGTRPRSTSSSPRPAATGPGRPR